VKALLLLRLVLATVSTAQAQTIDFSGQKVALVIGSDAGGAYDLYGRLVARHLGRFLPGHPTIVPQNMPGAGNLIAVNWLYNAAPRDGTALVICRTRRPTST
jgi:tripartite-type tricarboxylate transporter receptor subunit TctC